VKKAEEELERKWVPVYRSEEVKLIFNQSIGSSYAGAGGEEQLLCW